MSGRMVRAVGALVLAMSVQLHTLPAAAGRGCVTVEEFETAPFARKARVEAFWDASGRRTERVEPGSARHVAYEYDACGPGWVVVVYRRTSRAALQFWSWTPAESRVTR